MSHGEDQSLAQFWQDTPAADRDERRWLEGERITLEDLGRGSRSVIRCTAAQWWNAAKQQGEPREDAQPAARKGQGGPLVISFGKYKDRLAADVREEDPGYWNWMMRELTWFATKARAAGLCEDEEDAA